MMDGTLGFLVYSLFTGTYYNSSNRFETGSILVTRLITTAVVMLGNFGRVLVQ